MTLNPRRHIKIAPHDKSRGESAEPTLIFHLSSLVVQTDATVGIGFLYLPGDMAKTVTISDICHKAIRFTLCGNQIKAGK